MQVAAGAIRPLIGKLYELIKYEYGLEKKVKKGIKSIQTELEMMHAVLEKLARVPRDQLDKQVKIWAGKVRELSYDMEDAVDTFMVRVEGKGPEPAAGTNMKNRVKKFLKKTTGLFRKGKDLHQIVSAIEEAQELTKQYAGLRKRYELDIGSVKASVTVDPRVMALYKDEKELVGVEHPRDELIKKLFQGDDDSNLGLRVISIVGFGGLGKTTLAKAVYDKIKSQFDCNAFISASQSPDIGRIFKKILYGLDEKKYANINEATRDETQLIDELRSFLTHKRYLIVIDDVWETLTWKTIENAMVDVSCGSRVIITTRNFQVAKEAGHVFIMESLSDENSEKLFYSRVLDAECKCVPDNRSTEATQKILKKCASVPLSIITIASLLVDKPVEDWSAAYNSIGFGPEEENEVVQNTRKILSFSYYDLPSHLQPCLLYISIYPEDHWIEKDSLIWKWIAEGFVHIEQGKQLFEVGERYFVELINRSMIQPRKHIQYDSLDVCSVHDMVLDLIRVLAAEENYVKILDQVHEEHNYSLNSSVVRRVALHKRNQVNNDNLTANMTRLRSFNAILCQFSMLPRLLSFQVLRVLALDCCHIKGDRQLKHIGELRQLRYLGLNDTDVLELPTEITHLIHLQALVVRGTELDALPPTVGKLTKLMYLHVDRVPRVLTEVKNLTSMQDLRLGYVDHCPNFSTDLVKLTDLRILQLEFENMDEDLFKNLLQSLRSLRKIQVLEIRCYSGLMMSGWEEWEPPRQLRRFCIYDSCLPRLPAWVNFTCVPRLSHLELNVTVVEAGDLDVLAMMPALRVLDVSIKGSSWTVTGGKQYMELRYCSTNIVFKFWLLKLTNVGLSLPSSSGDAAAAEADVVSNLPLLKSDWVSFFSESATGKEVEEAQASLIRAVIQAYPNDPILFRYDTNQHEDALSTCGEIADILSDNDAAGEDEVSSVLRPFVHAGHDFI